MPKTKLFDDNESEEEGVSFESQNEYAKRYDAWREKEELYKLEQKYGDKPLDPNASLTSDSEDESDEEPEVSEEVETQFLKTLALLKKKDPRIYDPKFKFFDELKEEQKKPEENKGDEPKAKKAVSSIEAAFAGDDDDDDMEDIFKPAKEQLEPVVKEDKLKAYLTGEAEHIDQVVEQDLAPLKALWSDPAINDGEAFLRDYILDKKYLDKGDIGDAQEKLLDDEALEADEEIVEEQGKFERAYNFRFEEPDQEYLKRYPRTMSTIRPKDDKRAKKRQEVRDRKEEEKRRKMEEIARMKALKLKEIQEKIAKIKEVTGNEDLAFKDEDIEGDFDPAEHDRRMKAIFDEQYYDEPDDQKPVFPDLDEELEIENWDKYEDEQFAETSQDNAPHCEDEDFNMDADYDPKKSRTTLMEEIKETLGKKRRNRKQKSKLAEILTQEKPKFVPATAEKTYEQYLEEYYKLDCEDVIGGDLPTRFKYRDVVPNDFGLSVEEILLADDSELNRWASLKKTVKYRPEHVERGEVTTYRLKAADDHLLKKMIPSLFKDLPREPELIVPVETKKKKKKKKNKNKTAKNEKETVANLEETAENNEETSINTDEAELKTEETSNLTQDTTTDKICVIPKKKKKKNKKNKSQTDINISIESKDASKEELQTVVELKLNTISNLTNGTQAGNKKKRKQKNKPNEFTVENIQIGDTSQTSKKQNGTTDTDEKLCKNNNLKRKLLDEHGETTSSAPKKKKNRKKKDNNVAKTKDGRPFKKNFKNIDDKDRGSENPLNKLSDERLKAYGLNPKKYRSFLKYKKF